MNEKITEDLRFYIENIEFFEGEINKSEFVNENFDITKSTGRFVQGYASTPSWDSDGESIVKSGLDISYYNKQGFLNWMHINKPDHIIGIPVYSKIDHIGFFTKGMLFNNEMATHVWNLANELKAAGYPRKLGYSIEGKVVQRSAINKSKIIKAKVTNVAITHIPVNTDATFEVVSKSFVPPAYDEVISYISKDLELNKDLAALSSGNSAQTVDAPIKEGDTGTKVLQRESLESSSKKIVTGNPTDKELEERLYSAYKSIEQSKNEFATILKSVHPNASDNLIFEISNLIFKAGGIDNFVQIIKNSDILTKIS
jgi:hypothetical protein